MPDYSQQAIDISLNARVAYSKFITPNDAGITGGHQSGFHLHKNAYSLIWDTPRDRGSNDKKEVTIKWQESLETTSVFTYYGVSTRDEYRLTSFGKGFPYLSDESVGNLLVLCRVSDFYYKAYILETEEEIENYLNAFNIPVSNANGIVSTLSSSSPSIEELIQEYVGSLNSGFPVGKVLSEKAREFFNAVNSINTARINDNPDEAIMGWYGTETTLFKAVERKDYISRYSGSSFQTVDTFIDAAQSFLQRRKSRAGKALENHLSNIFDLNDLPYSDQKVTEGSKKPDFIIPSIEFYHNFSYSSDKLVFLGVKTTCKDRWRQILNEANRTPIKHLFTLQPGISKNQLDEMKDEGVVLVVPESNINTFAPESREDILSLKNFITYAKATIN